MTNTPTMSAKARTARKNMTGGSRSLKKDLKDEVLVGGDGDGDKKNIS
jgi:hypothetical protein